MNYLLLSQLRFLWQHRLQTLLAILGIMLGVCVVIAVELTNKSANQSFINSFDQLNENVSHQITGPSTGISTDIYQHLRRNLLPNYANGKAAPIIEGSARLILPDAADDNGPSIQVMGIDPISETALQRFNLTLSNQESENNQPPPDITQLMLNATGAFISELLAKDNALVLGDTFSVHAENAQHTLTVVGILPALNDNLQNLIITDIDTAQRLTSVDGFSRIDLQIAPDAHAEFENQLSEFLPSGYYWQKKEAVAGQTLHLTQSFQLNLQALSLLSLVVGVFLVYNTMNNFVIQRLPLFERLRALGVLSQQITTLLLIEVLIISLIATSIGILLGLKLAEFLVALSDQTINDLYYSTGKSQLYLLFTPLLKGAALGIGASIIAVLLPIKNAIHLNNSRAQTFIRLTNPALLLPALVLMIIGIIFSVWEASGVFGGFFAVFSILLGLAALTPILIFLIGKAIQKLFRTFGNPSNFIINMSIGDTYRNLTRTGVAAMALMVAVSSANGMGVMIGSFRLAVENWLHSRVNADIYVRADRTSNSQDIFISEDAIQDVIQIDGLKNYTLFTDFTAQVKKSNTNEPQYLPADWTSGRIPTIAKSGYSFVYQTQDDSIDNAWQNFAKGDVFVSETFASTHSVKPNDIIDVQTDSGTQQFKVAAIYYDYGNQNGRILSNRENLKRYWPSKGVESIGLYVTDAESSQAVKSYLDSIKESHKIHYFVGSDIVDIGLTVFDRTFIITHALKAFVLAVAMIAIFSSLTALQLERAAEFNTLRAIGFSRTQIATFALTQTAFLGFIVGLISLPTGELLAWLLIEIIHWRSFGWSMEFTPQWPIVFENALLAIFAATIAALYPTWKVIKQLHSPTQYD